MDKKKINVTPFKVPINTKSGSKKEIELDISTYFKSLDLLNNTLKNIKEITQTFVITNINNIKYENTDYYILWFKNNNITLKKYRQQSIELYQIDFNIGQIKHNNNIKDSHFLETTLVQLDHIADDLINGRASLLTKKEIQHYG